MMYGYTNLFFLKKNQFKFQLYLYLVSQNIILLKIRPQFFKSNTAMAHLNKEPYMTFILTKALLELSQENLVNITEKTYNKKY